MVYVASWGRWVPEWRYLRTYHCGHISRRATDVPCRHKDSRHPPLRSIEEKRAKTGVTKTATGRGEGYPPLPPPLFKVFVLLWKYTMRAYTGEVYMLSPSFNLYVFCALSCEGSYPDNGGKPVAEAAGAAARHKDHPPRLCLWCIYVKKCY